MSIQICKILFVIFCVECMLIALDNAAAINNANEDGREMNSQLGKSRSKRNLLQFGLMIACITRRNPLDYNNYGCWCGKGGGGKVVDAVDQCCKTHDECYDSILSFLCVPHIKTYSWICLKGVTCLNLFANSCAKKTCLCDKAAVECFKKSVYHCKYKKYDKSKCFDTATSSSSSSTESPDEESCDE